MYLLALATLAITGHSDKLGQVGELSVRAEIRPISEVVTTETPQGLVIAGYAYHGADTPTIIVPAGIPVLAATGVNLWFEEWFPAPIMMLAVVK